MKMRRFGLFTACALTAAVAATAARSQPQPAASVPSTEARRCAALAATRRWRTFPARRHALPRRGSSTSRRSVRTRPGIRPRRCWPRAASSRSCQIQGYVAPQNKFELRLPLPSQWNRKFHLTPCAGFCGTLSGDACTPALARGYASATGNGGHDGSFGFDGVWAANSPNLQEDFAWRHNHVITLAAKAITTAYYAQPIARSYMSGCSKGGHAALMEAQRFPEDFDGLIPSAPVYDFVGRTLAGAWFAQAVGNEEQGSVLDSTAAQAVHKSVLARCGAQAGVDEGLVTDPRSCDWRPEMVACSTSSGETGCLTPRQLAAVKQLMSPVVDSRGRVLYAYPDIPGTATEWAGWHFGRGANPAAPRAYANYILYEQFTRYMADPTVREGVDPLKKLDFAREHASLERATTLYDATSFDLRAFKARGGKMLMWHGLSDAAILATSSIAYYEGVEKSMGGRAATQDFFRLFLVPGVHHCAGGPGLTDFDALTLLENWVEKGQPPDVMIASRSVNGVTERTRPIYPYPMLARYSGQGDPKQAASYVPFDPSAARR